MVQVRAGTLSEEKRKAAGLPEPQGEVPPTWFDIATVTAPARAKRKTVIGLALVQSGVKPEVGGDPLHVRVLDIASSHVTEVAAVQPEPTLRLV